MGVLSKMLHALGGETDQRMPVRAVLAQACETGLKIALEAESVRHTMLMSSTIQHVREADVIIAQPTIDGQNHQLTFGENVTISFTINDRHFSGQTKCLGRIRQVAEHDAGTIGGNSSEAVVYGYRLSLPEQLQVQMRRSQANPSLAQDVRDAEVQLYAPGILKHPVHARLTDLTMNGAVLLTGLVDGGITAGRRIFLKTRLPEPVGLVDEIVNIVSVEPDLRHRECRIEVRFIRRVEGLEALIRPQAIPSR